MFIAMNRFQVIPGKEEAFEQVWLSRDSYLAGVPGFVEFHMLRGPAADDHVLYSSHTIWLSRVDFEIGPGPRRFARPIAARATTSRCTWRRPASKASTSSRP